MSALDTAARPSAGAAGTGARRRVTLRAALAVLAAGLVLAALYGRMMGYELRRDEMLYVPPAALLPEWQLYQDFFYNHVPYPAWLFRGFYVLFEPLGLLGATRLAVFAAWLLLLGGAAGFSWQTTRSAPLAALSALALAACTPLLTQAGMTATNNLLPLPFALWGMGLFILATLRAEEQGRAPGAAVLLLAGICLSLAAGMKVSAVAFIPPVAAAAFLLPPGLPLRQRLRRVVLPLVAGGLIGALPLFWYLLSSPGLFLAHVLKFHTGPHVAYWQDHAASEPGLALGLGGRLRLAYEVWLAGSALLLCLLLAALVLALLAARRGGGSQGAGALRASGRGQILMLLAALALSAALSLLPAPGFVQYYIPPLICLPLLAALLWRQLDPAAQAGLRPLLGAALLLCLLLAAPRLGPGLLRLASPDSFTSARVMRGGDSLQAALAGLPPGPVATFMPVYPLQAGLPVYPEFATGQFAYRIAPYLEPELRQHYRLAGAEDLEALFAQTPPGALLLGYEVELEAGMLAYARAHGYREVNAAGLNNRYGAGRLFVPPAAAAGADTERTQP